MPVWFSPFPIGQGLLDRLQQLGWRSWDGDLTEIPPKAWLLYATPDQLLADQMLSISEILSGYQILLSLDYPHRLISTWRLFSCPDDVLRLGETQSCSEFSWPKPDVLAAFIARLALDNTPDLLDAYLDLEMEAELLGGDPDVEYRQRLAAAINWQDAWAMWSSHLSDREAASQRSVMADEIAASREEAELTLLQLHQVQEELEATFLESVELKKQIASHQSEYESLSAASHQQAAALSSLEAEVARMSSELSAAQSLQEQERVKTQEAREEAELTLLQLHQVQEELEHYFLLSRKQAKQLDHYNKLLIRGESLISLLLGSAQRTVQTC